MQYHHHRARLAPPPPPFGRGGGFPRGGHKQLYAPPPPPPPMPLPAAAPPPLQRRYEVLMEAGRLAAEYLVTKGVLPPSSLQRGGGAAWAAPPLHLPPLPPPPTMLPPQQQEPLPLYGRRRYEDEYGSNPGGARPRRNSGTSSTSGSSRDDYSSGGYNGRGKRKYGEYRRGNSDWGREKEKERGRPNSNGRRYEENEDDDGAPGFRRERRGGGVDDDVRSSVTEAIKEAVPLTTKEQGESEMMDKRLKVVTCSGDVRKDDDALPAVLVENEEGEMEEDGKFLSSEPEVMEIGMVADGDSGNISIGVDMVGEVNHVLVGKVPDENPEDGDKVFGETALDGIALDDKATNLEDNLNGDEENLLKYCDFPKAPTRPRSLRANRKATSVQTEPAVPETADLVSSGEASQMVADQAANDSSVINIQSDNREDKIYQENSESNAVCDELMLHQESENSVVTESMREEKSDVQLHMVNELKEEIDVSPLTPSHKDSLMQETDLPPLTGSHKDCLIQETNLSLLTDSHKSTLIEETEPLLTYSDKDSLVEETDLSPLIASHKDSLMQESDLSQTVSSHENNLQLQFKEGTQICDIDMLPQDVDLIEFSDQRRTDGAELFPTVEAEAAIKMEEEKPDLASPFKICDIDLIGGIDASAIQNNTGSARCSGEGSSTGPHIKHEDSVTNVGDRNSGIDDLCQLPLDNRAVDIIDIEDDTPIKVGSFDSSKAKDEMICSMDNVMDMHNDDLPVIQDDYNLVISDYLDSDIPCYPSMQSDLHAGLGANDSEGIPVMDDPIYASLADIGFMDVWGQPAQDFEKFF